MASYGLLDQPEEGPAYPSQPSMLTLLTRLLPQMRSTNRAF